MIVKALDWLADNLEFGKALGLFAIGLFTVVLGTTYVEFFKGLFLYLAGGYIALFIGCIALLKIWGEKRAELRKQETAKRAAQETARRHKEQIDETKAVSAAIALSEQNLSARFDQLEEKLTQPTKQEIRELPISEADKATLSKVADLSEKGDAEGVLQELADDSIVAKEIEALAVNMAYRHLYRGIAYFELGKWQQSFDNFDRSISYRANDPEAWYDRGAALSKLDKYHEAIQSFDEAIKLSPHMSHPWFGRGWALCKLNQYQEAGLDFKKAIDHNPENIKAWALLGLTQKELKHYSEAILSFRQALKKAPSDWPARSLVEEAINEAEQNK